MPASSQALLRSPRISGRPRAWRSSSPSASSRDHQPMAKGDLAPRFNALVNKPPARARRARRDLGEALVLSPSEEAQRRARKGGDTGRRLRVGDRRALSRWRPEGRARVRRTLLGRAFEAVERLPRDAKTALQEWAAARARRAALFGARSIRTGARAAFCGRGAKSTVSRPRAAKAAPSARRSARRRRRCWRRRASMSEPSAAQSWP